MIELPALVPLLHIVKPTSSGRYVEPRATVPASRWSEVIARRAAGESYRSLALAFGVSHETICSILGNGPSTTAA